MFPFLRKVPLALGYALLGVSIAGFLSGSSCIYTSDYCDDDDDTYQDDDDDHCDDDDDHGFPAPSSARPTVSLVDAGEEVFRVDPSRMFVTAQGDVRRVETLDGLSLFAFKGVEVASEADLNTFGTRILHANAGYLGWSEVPSLRYLGVIGTPTGMLLGYETASESVTVELDGSGCLVSIESQSNGR